MTTRENVEEFLRNFKFKTKIYQIVFCDFRTKNLETLAELEISAAEREKIVRNIEVEDFSEGPLENTLNNFGEMWVFGKFVKNKEVYIKITMGLENNSTICISFHIAEHQMKYPLK